MKNTFGSDLSLTIFGESHGRAVGAVLDGMAAGVPVDESFLAACMDKRRARGDGLSTPRVEADAVQLLSGVVNGHTTGTAIALMIENQNTRSGDYAKTADLLRPGHADFTAYAKYHGFQDARGGGHFSGRVTAALVAGGSIVLAALQRAGIDITTHIARCAGLADTPFALDDPAALAAQAAAPNAFVLWHYTMQPDDATPVTTVAHPAQQSDLARLHLDCLIAMPWNKLYRRTYARQLAFDQAYTLGEDLQFVLDYLALLGRYQPDFSYRNTPVIELAGKRIGIVGFGRTGAATARLAAAFGMEVAVYTSKPESALPAGYHKVGLDELFASSDVVSLHCPLNQQTAEMVNASRLAQMKQGAILINTGRGGLVDEAALAEALKAGRLLGAGLDVLTSEPPAADHPLIHLPNCFITPHIAWATAEARARLLDRVVENIKAWVAGSPVNVVG